MKNIYDFKVKKNSWEEIFLKDFEWKVILIVNIAIKCGLSWQLVWLEKLYQKYKQKWFVVLAFPCWQFANQELKENDEIQKSCKVNFWVSFPVFAKINVNWKNESPLYTFLKSQKKWFLNARIKWNFSKFLIDKNWNVVKRFSPIRKAKKLESEIEKLLK